MRKTIKNGSNLLYLPVTIGEDSEIGDGLTRLLALGVELAFNFCRTSRIFSCKLVLVGNISACLA